MRLSAEKVLDRRGLSRVFAGPKKIKTWSREYAGQATSSEEDRDYIEFLERCVTSDGRGAVAALFLVIATILIFAIFAYVKHFYSSEDDFKPRVLAVWQSPNVLVPCSSRL